VLSCDSDVSQLMNDNVWSKYKVYIWSNNEIIDIMNCELTMNELDESNCGQAFRR